MIEMHRLKYWGLRNRILARVNPFHGVNPIVLLQEPCIANEQRCPACTVQSIIRAHADAWRCFVWIYVWDCQWISVNYISFKNCKVLADKYGFSYDGWIHKQKQNNAWVMCVIPLMYYDSSSTYMILYISYCQSHHFYFITTLLFHIAFNFAITHIIEVVSKYKR